MGQWGRVVGDADLVVARLLRGDGAGQIERDARRGDLEVRQDQRGVGRGGNAGDCDGKSGNSGCHSGGLDAPMGQC
jgi:hypothetical protein